MDPSTTTISTIVVLPFISIVIATSCGQERLRGRRDFEGLVAAFLESLFRESTIPVTRDKGTRT